MLGAGGAVRVKIPTRFAFGLIIQYWSVSRRAARLHDMHACDVVEKKLCEATIHRTVHGEVGEGSALWLLFA